MFAFSARVVALVFAVGLLAFGASHANAQDFDPQAYENALAGFTTDSFDDTDKAIIAVAVSGNPLAAQVIEALRDSRLLFSAEQKKVYFRDAAGAIVDALTGQPAAGAAPPDLKPVRLNNRLRRTIDAAIGNLSLLAPDPARRLEAARAVFKSRDASALPALDAAIGRETVAAVKKMMLEARAAIILLMPDAKEADRIEAVSVIRGRGDQDALGLLASLPADTPPAVLRAANDAIAAIQSSLAVWETAQNAWYGLSLGSVLLLAAIGLAITFGVMGVINMAHGEMVMLGAYTTFVVQEIIRARSPGLFDYSLFIAIPLAFLIAGSVGVLIERGIIRFLYGRPLETLLATWGLSLILQQAVRTAFGPTNKDVGNPSWMSGAFELGHITITYNRMWI
ncbi:MAG: urea transport system permease protein, partial [Alphaproteobacteria bacterium]|nr:urea transport system permease protein [Alphaproteobacteria bacterium]